MKHITQFASEQSGVLHHLLQHSQVVIKINSLLSAKLSPAVLTHCQVMNLREQTLVIRAGSAAWATRLRFTMPALLEQLQHDWPTGLPLVTRLEICVRPVEPLSAPAKPVFQAFSPSVSSLLRSTAESTPHTALKATLLRMASR